MAGDRVVVWDLAGKEPTVVAHEDVRGNTAGLSPDGQTLYLTVDAGDLVAVDLEGSRSFLPVVAKAGLDAEAQGVQLSPDGTKVASSWMDGVGPVDAQVKDLTTGRLGPRVELRQDYMGSGELDWSPDGRLLSTTTGGPDVALLDASTIREVSRASVAPAGATTAAFAPDGEKLLVGTSSGSVHVLSVPGLEPVRAPIEVGVDAVVALAVSPNGRDVVAHGTSARIIDYSTGRLGSTIGTKEEPPHAQEFSPDGQRLVVSWEDGRVGLFDVGTNSWLAAPNAAHPHGGYLWAWSTDGGVVASSANGKVAAWDGRTGAFLGAVAAPDGAVGITEDGEVLIAAQDGTIRTWDPRSSA